jgi:hypothetical protein
MKIMRKIAYSFAFPTSSPVTTASEAESKKRGVEAGHQINEAD